jgi:NADH:ubiquinone oxidoreductase subunit 4 (subunit M)
MLWAVERVFFGPSREPPRQGHGHAAADHGAHAADAHGHGPADHAASDRCDLRWHEAAALLPLAVFVLWIGLAPATFLAPPAAQLRSSTAAAAAAFDAMMKADGVVPPAAAPAVAGRVVSTAPSAGGLPLAQSPPFSPDRP